MPFEALFERRRAVLQIVYSVRKLSQGLPIQRIQLPSVPVEASPLLLILQLAGDRNAPDRLVPTREHCGIPVRSLGAEIAGQRRVKSQRDNPADILSRKSFVQY